MKAKDIIDSICFLLIMGALIYSLRYAELINTIIIELKGV